MKDYRAEAERRMREAFLKWDEDIFDKRTPEEIAADIAAQLAEEAALEADQRVHDFYLSEKPCDKCGCGVVAGCMGCRMKAEIEKAVKEERAAHLACHAINGIGPTAAVRCNDAIRTPPTEPRCTHRDFTERCDQPGCSGYVEPPMRFKYDPEASVDNGQDAAADTTTKGGHMTNNRGQGEKGER